MLGLQTAIVINNIDPLMQARVQIKINSQTEEGIPIWARLGNVFASNHAGFVFIPDIGDEVIVGFIGNQLDEPVVLGSLYSKSQQIPFQSNGFDGLKGIVTKNQLKISFDDIKKTISIDTPAGNSIAINDQMKSVVINDQNGNNITLGPEGISIHSPKDIVLNAGGELKLNTTTKLNVNAKSDIEIAGLNVKVDAKMSAKVSGNATAELSAGGKTTVKGALVMIN